MADANQNLFDSSLRHQVGIRRFAAGEVRRILELLERADRDLVRQLRIRLRVESQLSFVERLFVTKRLAKLLRDVRDARRTIMRELGRRVRRELMGFAEAEVEFERRLISAAIPIEIEFAGVEFATLREVVFRRPFQGRLLREWFQSMERIDQRRLTDAIQLGVAQQESVDQIVRRVAGTRARRFTDGVLAITRRNAEAVVRTAINHVANQAREAFWSANEELLGALRWTSTLDGRTSPICQARDGKLAPIGGKPLPEGALMLTPPGARPPAHVSCRSIMVAVLDAEGVVGNRPFVVDTRGGRRREVDFRRMAREQGRNIRDVRREWAQKNVGTTPAFTTYDAWLRRQSAKFQDQVLGRTRAILFRRGGLRVDRFVDRAGNELTLEQLKRTVPEAFEEAGLAA